MTSERIFNGIPLGSSIEASHGHLYLFQWVFGKNKNLADLNFGADIDTYTTKLAPYLNAENPDLSAFAKRGGKLIMTLGTADFMVHHTRQAYVSVKLVSARTVGTESGTGENLQVPDLALPQR